MKSKLIGCLIGTAIITASTSQLNAADNYFGIKAGQMSTSISLLGNATNVGAVMGFPLQNPSTSIEAELTTTVSKGDVDFSSAEWDVTTLAGYFVYRTPKSTYLKLKGGLLYEDVTIDSFFGNSASGTDTGLSVGAGVGFDLGNAGKLEVEATIIEEDITFISVGYLF